MKARCIIYHSFLWALANSAAIANAAAPIIDFQPKDQTVLLYQQAVFGVIARGTAPQFYQWRRNGAPITGATNDQIVLMHAQFADIGKYSIVVSNAENSVASAEALLTVNSPQAGDIDCTIGCGGQINEYVRCVAVQPDGKVLIAGLFATVGGAIRNGIARLNTDGTTDFTFISPLSGASISSLVVQNDGKVLIANGMARLNTDGSADTTFVPAGGSAPLAIQSDGKLLAGTVRLKTDGSLDTSFQVNVNVNSSIAAIAVQGDGKVLIGGYFTEVNGVSRNRIARLHADGSLDTSFLNGLSGTDQYGEVYSVAVQSDGKILIGGAFSFVNGVERYGIARLHPDGRLDAGFNAGVGGVVGKVFSIVAQADGKVLIGGGFGGVNGEVRNGIARLNADGTLDHTFLNGLAGTAETYYPGFGMVYSVAVQRDGKVLIGGNFNTVNGVRHKSIARLHLDGNLDGGFQNQLSWVNGSVRSAVEQIDGKVVFAGGFSTVNGVSRTNLARIYADGGLDLSFNPVAGNDPIALQSDGKVIARTVRLNQDGSLDSSYHVDVNARLLSLAVQKDGKVLIGGRFTTVNGVNRKYLARLNTNGTLDGGFLDGLSGADGYVHSIAVQNDGKVLLAGDFSTVNGVSRSCVARLNADGNLDTEFLNGLSGASGGWNDIYYANSVVAQNDGKVLVGGSFFLMNGIPRVGLARLNNDGTLDTGFLSDWDGIGGGWPSVNSIAFQTDGKVLIGGSFQVVNGVNRRGIARLNVDGTLDTSFQNLLSGAFGSVNSVAVQSNGSVLIAGDFTSVNGVAALGIARLWGTDYPPSIKSINRSGADVNLSWYAISNRTYRVQYNGNLSATNWTDLAGDVSATGATASKTDTTLGGASQRLYRVVLLP